MEPNERKMEFGEDIKESFRQYLSHRLTATLTYQVNAFYNGIEQVLGTFYLDKEDAIAELVNDYVRAVFEAGFTDGFRLAVSLLGNGR